MPLAIKTLLRMLRIGETARFGCVDQSRESLDAAAGRRSIGRPAQPGHLAKMPKSDANVILLDEPAHDLDLETPRALEHALTAFAGPAVVVSHDRWFLDRLATHILAFENEGHAEWFAGNFQNDEADKMRRPGAVAIEPHRLRCRPLSR